MKPKVILTGLTALWALLVLLEGASSAVRGLYARGVVRAVSGLIGYAKTALLIALAISNAVLFLRHVDDRPNR